MKCYNCGKDNVPNITYCSECGTQLRGEKIDYNDENKKYFIQTLVLFLCVLIVIVTAIVSHFSFLIHEYIFSGLLILITLVFAFLDFRNFVKIFRFSFHFNPVIKIILGAPLLAILVIYLARFLNVAIGKEDASYYEEFRKFSNNPYFYGILFVSIIPGFIEKLLFRGILFNHLLKLTSPKSTIVISCILFSFLHFSFFSILWLATIGLFLGYLRFRYRTIWYSIFFHALYNGSVFFLEMYI
jgi:uncharacterized protein